MRCPTCGTDNTPDSRFCGGCGARTTEPPKLAPTKKIADDARWDTPSKQAAVQPPPPGHLSQPPQMPARIASTPPPAAAPMPMTIPGAPMPVRSQPSRPQLALERATTAQPSAPPVSTPRPAVSPIAQPDRSMPVPRRGRGLMIAVLLIDLALAGVGGALLVQGLRFRANVERVDEQHH
jgi:hypothetical protein